MDEGDKLAIATMAASRCVALQTLAPSDYVGAYAAIEAEFKAFRTEQGRKQADQTIETYKKLARA